MDICFKILEDSYKRAVQRSTKSLIADRGARDRIDAVALCLKNRAGVRALLAGLLAKIHLPNIDIRKPYTEIMGDDGADRYSGRWYDEQYIQRLTGLPYRLPINSTTAFLTPGFRTKNIILKADTQLEGRPADMYKALLHIFDDVQCKRLSPRKVMDETIRLLILERAQRDESIRNLVRDIRRSADRLPLSSEDIIVLLGQHLACKNASRVPVLIVAAAYHAASEKLGETVGSLNAHNAADRRTGALGDIEITLQGNDGVTTAYEMKMKPVTIADVNIALEKLAGYSETVQNYIFITTEGVAGDVREYAAAKYEELGGIEIAILDCIGFIRHFLHLFHGLRTEFLDAYQRLLLEEPDSAVSHALKEAFLALRRSAEGAQ